MQRKTTLYALLLVIFAVIATPVAFSEDVDEKAAREIFRLLNQERTSTGLAALDWDDRLAQAAVEHSRLLAESKSLSHQFPGEPALRQRYAKYDIRLDRAGENVAYDSSIRGAHEGFMHSPPHRKNILSPQYNAVGIGVIKRGGVYYVTQNFAHRLAELSTSTVEDEIAAALERLRASQGQRNLRRVRVPDLRPLACKMAQDDRVEPALARNLRGARHFVAYTASEPGDLPENVVGLRTGSEVDRFAVGTCFERSEHYPNGVYWVMLVFFQSSEGIRGD